ncbi:hypothetical protein quinque_010887 [Culex quinquefasciatus]
MTTKRVARLGRVPKMKKKIFAKASERMAREASVSVPYHKPKWRTLEEFLNWFKIRSSPRGRPPKPGRCHSDASGTARSVRQVSGGAREGNDRVATTRSASLGT